MKKIIVFLFIIIICVFLFKHDDQKFVIPSESIRFRIIANSNKESDQAIKQQIKEKIIPVLENIEENSANIIESRNNIKKSFPEIEKILQNSNFSYNINFGNNYFPLKKYGEYYYNEGYYESLVITLGKGLGDNWWCVLFPPLCLMETKNNDLDNIKYDFYFKNIIAKYY